MEITRTLNDRILVIALDGRLDGYWSDHLERALADAIADGHHRIQIDCAKVTFLSSAGIGVLVKLHKRLAKVNGSFQVINPSKPVSTILTITHLTQLLAEPARVETAATRPLSARRVERDGAAFDIIDLDARASLECRAIGSARSLLTGAAGEECVSLAPLAPTFALGIGAFGESDEECRSRCGELVTVANATAYQPGDGSNVPDYLVAKGEMASNVRVLYGLTCKGSFSQLIRFEALQSRTTIGLARLLDECLDAAGADALGIVMVAEAAGLVGAALRRSPAAALDEGGFFAHPGIRTRLAFTSEPAFVRGVALAAGVVTRQPNPPSLRALPSSFGGINRPSVNGEDNPTQLRPLGGACRGHIHAAAFDFRPIRKGPIDFKDTVIGLFEGEPLLGVLHLLHDDRGATGAGESAFVRGACWIAPLSEGWAA